MVEPSPVVLSQQSFVSTGEQTFRSFFKLDDKDPDGHHQMVAEKVLGYKKNLRNLRGATILAQDARVVPQGDGQVQFIPREQVIKEVQKAPQFQMTPEVDKILKRMLTLAVCVVGITQFKNGNLGGQAEKIKLVIQDGIHQIADHWKNIRQRMRLNINGVLTEDDAYLKLLTSDFISNKILNNDDTSSITVPVYDRNHVLNVISSGMLKDPGQMDLKPIEWNVETSDKRFRFALNSILWLTSEKYLISNSTTQESIKIPELNDHQLLLPVNTDENGNVEDFMG